MADVATTSSASVSAVQEAAARPSAHTQRYDRQLRLWASSGQVSLEKAKILVLGASHLGACVLKNLILPGIGSFTLVDGNPITEYDLNNNFFIDGDGGVDKGKGRAKEQLKNLCELNPSVRGFAIEQDPAQFVDSSTDDLGEFTLIIVVNQPHDTVRKTAKKAWEKGVPLMSMTSAGFIGEVRVQVREAAIIETHPDSIVDLRLTRPWPALQAYANGYKVDGIDSMEHSHIPYIVLLLRRLQEWKESHGGAAPNPSEDRKAFTDSINAFRQAENADAENVDEALEAMGQHVWRPISNADRSKIPDEIRALFSDVSCVNITSESSNFWLLVRALGKFVEQNDGLLPLPGALPDMKALSATYIQLQKLYREKSQEDLANFRHNLETVLKEEANLPIDAIGQEEIESFAKHASYLKLIRGLPLWEGVDIEGLEEKRRESYKTAIAMAFLDPLNPIVMPHHIALLASEKFLATRGNNRRYPGSSRAMTRYLLGKGGEMPEGEEESEGDKYDFDSDLNDVLNIAKDLFHVFSIEEEEQQEAIQDACREMVRSGHADLPSTAALLGGIAAQEAIKLVTKQYIPIDNTVTYDGVKQALGVYRL